MIAKMRTTTAYSERARRAWALISHWCISPPPIHTSTPPSSGVGTSDRICGPKAAAAAQQTAMVMPTSGVGRAQARGQDGARQRMVAGDAGAGAGDEVADAGGAQFAVEVEIAALVELDAGGVHQRGDDGEHRNGRKAQRLAGDRRPVDQLEIGRQQGRPQGMAARQRHQPMLGAQRLVRDPRQPDDKIEQHQGGGDGRRQREPPAGAQPLDQSDCRDQAGGGQQAAGHGRLGQHPQRRVDEVGAGDGVDAADEDQPAGAGEESADHRKGDEADEAAQPEEAEQPGAGADGERGQRDGGDGGRQQRTVVARRDMGGDGAEDARHGGGGNALGDGDHAARRAEEGDQNRDGGAGEQRHAGAAGGQ